MVRLLLLLFCSFIPLSVFAAATSEIDKFLASRHLVTQVFFIKQTAELSDLSRQQLNGAASQLVDYAEQQMLIRVEGFASPDGEDQYNMQLSLQRALAVADYLLHTHNLRIPVFFDRIW